MRSRRRPPPHRTGQRRERGRREDGPRAARRRVDSAGGGGAVGPDPPAADLEPLLGLLTGIVLGPAVAGLLDVRPRTEDSAWLHTATRILLAISVMAVALG